MKIIKINLLSFIFLFFIGNYAFTQTSEDVLNNEAVVKLVKSGLGEGIVINKIKTSSNVFDLSTSALIELKNAGVSDKIVETMLEASQTKKITIVDLNDPLSKQKPGIYYYNYKVNQKSLFRLDPTVVSAGKTGGVGQALASSYSYGMSNTKVTSILSGATAHRQINSKPIEFYIYLDGGSSATGQNSALNWWFANATSPNEFALIKLNQKKDSRQFDTGKANAYGSSVGIDEKQKVRFTYTEVADGIFKITIPGDLPSGEYCFIYTGSIPSMYSNDKVFDFGIL